MTTQTEASELRGHKPMPNPAFSPRRQLSFCWRCIRASNRCARHCCRSEKSAGAPRRRQLPQFLEASRPTREASWKVAPIPADLLDRRVEITGPPDRKMIINALNSGANVFMADFEDSNSPTWTNCIEGQQNLRDAVAAHH